MKAARVRSEAVMQPYTVGDAETATEFSTLPQSILNEFWPREDRSVSGSCSHTTSLHDRALNCIRRRHGEPCSWTIISGSVEESTQ